MKEVTQVKSVLAVIATVLVLIGVWYSCVTILPYVKRHQETGKLKLVQLVQQVQHDEINRKRHVAEQGYSYSYGHKVYHDTREVWGWYDGPQG